MNIKKLFTILLSIFFTASLLGCANAAKWEQAYIYERPAIGFTVDDEVITNVIIDKQSRLAIEAQNGIIKIAQWDKEYLQIIERRKLKGPSAKKNLKTMLGKNTFNIEKTSFQITLEKEPEKEPKPFFRRTDDIELMVPETLKNIDINAKNGGISLSGIRDMQSVNITLKNGSINMDNCEVYKVEADIANGDIDMAEIEGSGRYKCGRGNINLRDITGDIELQSVSGDTVIEKAEGKLDADISLGSITVKNSRLIGESVLYATYGNIGVDLEGLEASGKCSIKAAKGNIRLKMPEKTGVSLQLRSTKGRIVDNLGLASEKLVKAPAGGVYGSIGGGGSTVDVYVDRGDIYLEKGE